MNQEKTPLYKPAYIIIKAGLYVGECFFSEMLFGCSLACNVSYFSRKKR